MRYVLLVLLLVAMTGCGDVSGVESIGLRFASIPAGTFVMGDGEEEGAATPSHQVTLTRGFELSICEITQEQYESVMGTNPSKFKGPKNPVEQVTWEEATEFCRRLSEMPKEKAAGLIYRLPSEAEWEYACRAGTGTKYSFGDYESSFEDYAWLYDNSETQDETVTATGFSVKFKLQHHPVGEKKPNAWGLYDMHGNVSEWCQDRYGKYTSDDVTDPTGPSAGGGRDGPRASRVHRGGNVNIPFTWSLKGYGSAASAGRGLSPPQTERGNLGFRVLRSSVESTGSANTATVELQDASRTGEDTPEVVAAQAGDAEEDPRWYERFVVSQDNQRALQSGTIKPREVVTIDLEAKNKRHIGFGTNVFQDRIRFKDGETIIFHQTKGTVAGIGVTSKDGNGGGQEFTPVDGQLCFQLENNSNHTLKYVIYEVVENEEAIPHPTSGNATSSQSQTQGGVPVVNSIGMHLVPIPAGTFTRGQGESAHKVTLTQAFHLGQYEVTQEQYKQVMGSNPSGFKEATHPVETVNWREAVEFCRKLSAMPQEKSAGFIYRLPTDAEWEYASRAGTTTGFSFGDASAEMGDYGWLTSNSQETTHPIGQKKPNPWGLYDMYGNVWEWCLDWDGRRSSGSSVSVTDPTGPASGALRVFRGGGWKSSPRNCRPDNRGKLAEVYRGNTLGLRVVRTPAIEQIARPASKPTKAVATVVNSIGMRFVKIPSGKFNIGGKKDGPQVTLSLSFQMGQCEVTQEQYQKVMGTNPSRFSGPQNPVERVNWYDAVDFCRKLSELPEEKKLAYVYRLPTQAEWEYAGRAGATTVFSFGDSDAELGMYAWYSKNSGSTTHPVGEKNPNVWGLHDMHGNVQEWCQDNVMEYSSGVVDPIGNAASKFRCLRGGMWLWGSDYHRFTYCPGIRPNDRDRIGTTGFRVVRTHVE